MKKTIRLLLIVLLSMSLIATFSLSGCKKATTAETTAVTTMAAETTAAATTAAENLGEIKTRGPQGQVPVWYNQISLTDEEKAKVKEGHYKIAYDEVVATEFNDAIGNGIKYQCEQLNMELVSWTLNNLDAAKQKENIESVLALKPDIIVGLSVDPVVSRDIFKKAADQGVKLVFASNKPGNFEWKKDYTGALVIFDFNKFGAFLADELNKALNGKGKIGYLYHDADFFITNQRDQGFKEALKNYPGLEIVAEVPWSGVVEDAETSVAAMMIKNPEITGVYVTWAAGAMAAVSALRAANRPDVKVVTNDLEATAALEMIKGNNIVGLTQCKAWQYGLTAAELGCYAMLGKEIPAECILIPGLVATKDNVEPVWKEVFNEELPDQLKQALAK
jgi:ribose transport system substrate-binding protein